MNCDYPELWRVYRYTYARTRWFVRIPEREKEYSRCKWVVSIGAYQITIHGSPRKFLINEGILENNSIKGHQLMRYCEKFIDESGAKDFSELKKTVPLDSLPAHFQFC